MSGFAAALPHILKYEGGYVDDPLDRGGATNKGVTQAVYDSWRVAGELPKRSVRNIEDSEVEAIYHRRYWLDGKCEALPWPLSLAHFDGCVNHGLRNAAILLQRAVGAHEDGAIGPQTLQAVQDAGAPVGELLWARVDFYLKIVRRRSSQVRFLLGWITRVLQLRKAAR